MDGHELGLCLKLSGKRRKLRKISGRYKSNCLSPQTGELLIVFPGDEVNVDSNTDRLPYRVIWFGNAGFYDPSLIGEIGDRKS